MNASPTYKRMATASKSELERIFRQGEQPSLDALAGYEYRGYNHPQFAELLGIRKFIKGFFKDGDAFYGYNTPARQNGLQGPWLALPDGDAPKRFAFYLVTPAKASAGRSGNPAALLLDYSRSGNFVHSSDPSEPIARLLRDYLVRVEPGSDTLLLGKAYLGLGGWRPFLNFFLLERHGPATGPAIARS